MRLRGDDWNERHNGSLAAARGRYCVSLAAYVGLALAMHERSRAAFPVGSFGAHDATTARVDSTGGRYASKFWTSYKQRY